MYHFLAHIPNIDFANINKVREKFDPNFKYLDPHIAVLFPIDDSISEPMLIDHIQGILRTEKSFNIQLDELTKSWDHYLYLEINEGRKEIIRLHDSLYSGLLEKYWFKNIKYQPHISLGFFAERQAKFDMSDINDIKFYDKNYHTAMNLVTDLNLKYTTKFDKLSLIRREDKQSPGIIVKEFKLLD